MVRVHSDKHPHSYARTCALEHNSLGHTWAHIENTQIFTVVLVRTHAWHIQNTYVSEIVKEPLIK